VREKAMSLCLIPKIPHTLREGIYHKRETRESHTGISEFYLKICKNSRAIVDQRTRDMALDLTVASDGCKPHGGR